MGARVLVRWIEGGGMQTGVYEWVIDGSRERRNEWRDGWMNRRIDLWDLVSGWNNVSGRDDSQTT